MYLARFDDPEGKRYGIPTYNFRCAPDGFATKRQLAAMGLRRGQREPEAQILWRRGKRVAHLYTIAEAKKKKPATPAQMAALELANQARRTCPTCNDVKWYVIPTRYGECFDCVQSSTGEVSR